MLNDFYQRCHSHNKLLRRFIALLNFPVPISSNLKQDLLLATYPTPTSYSLETTLHWLTTLDLRLDLESISLPILQIFGTKDNLTPISVAQNSKILNPNIKQAFIKDASHHPFLTHPQTIFPFICKFFKSIQ